MAAFVLLSLRKHLAIVTTTKPLTHPDRGFRGEAAGRSSLDMSTGLGVAEDGEAKQSPALISRRLG